MITDFEFFIVLFALHLTQYPSIISSIGFIKFNIDRINVYEKIKKLNKIVNIFNFVAEPFYLLYANYIMSVSIGKITIDKVAMLVMVGAVVAFVVGFLVSINL